MYSDSIPVSDGKRGAVFTASRRGVGLLRLLEREIADRATKVFERGTDAAFARLGQPGHADLVHLREFLRSQHVIGVENVGGSLGRWLVHVGGLLAEGPPNLRQQPQEQR
jgi:hypothetical protein